MKSKSGAKSLGLRPSTMRMTAMRRSNALVRGVVTGMLVAMTSVARLLMVMAFCPMARPVSVEPVQMLFSVSNTGSLMVADSGSMAHHAPANRVTS